VSRTRTLTVGVALAALFVSAVPAGAATDTFAAEAASAGVSLTIAGEDALEVGSTFASAIPGQALAIATPAALGGEAFGQREAESDGPEVSDPEAGAARCEGEVPPPFDGLIGVGLACADAFASGAEPAALATAGLAEANVLTLDGEVGEGLAELIATLPLDEIVAQVQEQLLDQLDDAFGDVRAQCLEALEPLNVGGLLDPVLEPLEGASPEEMAALIAQLRDLLGATVPVSCEVLAELAELIVGGELLDTIASGAIVDQLTGAEGLISISLLETEAGVGADDLEVSAIAGPADGAIRITLDIPLLEELLGDLLRAVLEPVLGSLQELLAPVADAAAEIPELGPLVADLLASGDLGALLAGPLLDVGVAPGSAAAIGEFATGDLEGAAEPALVALDGALFDLPVLAGLDDLLDDAARELDDALLAELRSSPLADLVAVELLPADVEDDEIGGLSGIRATSGTASVQVLGVLEEEAGGALFDLDVAPATAGVGLGAEVVPAGPEPTPATPTPTPTPASLPVTGGSAAIVGLLALGAAAALRRRD
jgi:MYXO-CTERM domain-containing protein